MTSQKMKKARGRQHWAVDTLLIEDGGGGGNKKKKVIRKDTHSLNLLAGGVLKGRGGGKKPGEAEMYATHPRMDKKIRSGGRGAANRGKLTQEDEIREGSKNREGWVIPIDLKKDLQPLLQRGVKSRGGRKPGR